MYIFPRLLHNTARVISRRGGVEPAAMKTTLPQSEDTFCFGHERCGMSVLNRCSGNTHCSGSRQQRSGSIRFNDEINNFSS
ncbi:hypothetical protein EYF80_050233 [Liparis tanakae]|uniref:Uncharacterized protein n=1 Tax=Liparis tanakae TaxID=230148 RepID=A0A4Z2FFR2_9TELE|nr:hypothetical protein EYF80_050233 [Liparis tanakae]